MSEEISTVAPLPKATWEQIDAIAKSLVKMNTLLLGGLEDARRAKESYIRAGKEAEFNEAFSTVIEECWAGTTEEDEKERIHYRHLAIAALKTLGYEVEITDPVLKAILV